MLSPSLLEAFGQMFMLAYDGREPTSDVKEFFCEFNIGGVILFADNYESPQHLRAMCQTIQTRMRRPGAPRLFIATDHEGGRVQRFRSGFTRLPPMSALGHGSAAETEKIIGAAARELAGVGINMNLAPVGDLCSADCEGAIGDRSFAENPVLAAEHVAAAVRAMAREGIVACAKHFPGHGATAVDSHREMPVVHLTIDELRANDLVPFRAAIAAGVEAIMTAHVMFPHAGDAVFPASLSSYWVRKVLREEMGFNGVVVTDAIEMDGLLKHYNPVEAGLAAIRAGADVLIYYRIEEQFRATYALRQAALEGLLDAVSIADSLARIARVKRHCRVLKQETWMH